VRIDELPPISAFQFKPLIGRVATTNADLKSGFHLLLRCAVRGEFRMRKETGKLARVVGSEIRITARCAGGNFRTMWGGLPASSGLTLRLARGLLEPRCFVASAAARSGKMRQIDPAKDRLEQGLQAAQGGEASRRSSRQLFGSVGHVGSSLSLSIFPVALLTRCKHPHAAQATTSYASACSATGAATTSICTFDPVWEQRKTRVSIART